MAANRTTEKDNQRGVDPRSYVFHVLQCLSRLEEVQGRKPVELQPIGQLRADRIEINAAALLEIGELRNLQPIQRTFLLRNHAGRSNGWPESQHLVTAQKRIRRSLCR
jgi:hypothetical protein